MSAGNRAVVEETVEGSDCEMGDEDDLLSASSEKTIKAQFRRASSPGRRSKQRPREAQSLDPVWRRKRRRKANPGLSQRKTGKKKNIQCGEKIK